MRMRGFALLLALLLAVTGAAAEGPSSATMIDFEAREAYAPDGNLCVVLYTSSPSVMNAASMTVKLDEDRLDVLSVVPLGESELATSYLFLLDNAYSVSRNNQWRQAVDALSQVFVMLPGNASAAVLTVRQLLEGAPISLSTDRSRLTADLDAVKLLGQQDPEQSIRLAVSKAPDALSRAEGVAARQVIVVVSDGLEETADAITAYELTAALEGKSCVMHTLALKQRGDANAAQSQEMGSWSRALSGMALSLPYDAKFNGSRDSVNTESDTFQIAQQLMGEENSLMLARCAVPAGYSGQNAQGRLELKVRYDKYVYTSKKEFSVPKDVLLALRAGVVPAQPTAAPALTDAPTQAPTQPPIVLPVDPATDAPAQTVAASDDGGVIVESVDVVTPEPTATPDSNPTDTEADKGFFDRALAFAAGVWQQAQQPLWFGLPIWAYAAAGLVLIILLIVLLAGCSRRKKKRMQSRAQDDWDEKQRQWKEQSISTSMEAPLSEEGQTLGPAAIGDVGQSTDGRTMGPMNFASAQPGQTRYILTWLNGPRVEQFLHVSGSAVVVGRSRDKAQWAFPNSKRMSGRHFQLEREGERVFITDLQSTNGTTVNGRALQGRAELPQDATIVSGDYTFRFNWMDVR